MATRIGQKSNWYKHGKTGTSEYMAWHNMIGRCHSLTHQGYHKYGARGIKVCDRWRHDFTNFLEDMGTKPTPKHTLDRLDNDGDYTPENCHWATPYQQTHNRRPAKAYRRKGDNKYIGVRKKGPSYSVFQRIENGGVIQLGGFTDIIDAAYVRDQIVLQGRDPIRSLYNVIDKENPDGK